MVKSNDDIFYEELGNMIIHDIYTTMLAHSHIATREAVQSWRVEGKQVVSTSEGAYYLEHGRHPNRRPPPIEEIIKWCKAKAVDTRKAWAIRNKIARDGIPATHLIEGIADKYGLEYAHER